MGKHINKYKTTFKRVFVVLIDLKTEMQMSKCFTSNKEENKKEKTCKH